MGELLRRREMTPSSGGTPPGPAPLHPLKDGNYKGTNGQASHTEVSLGHHIYVYKQYGDASWNVKFPFVSGFSLVAGDVVEFKVNFTRITGCTVQFRLMDAESGYKTLITGITAVGEYSATVTMADGLEVTRLYFGITSGSAKKYYDCDVEIYVNGVRYT